VKSFPASGLAGGDERVRASKARDFLDFGDSETTDDFLFAPRVRQPKVRIPEVGEASGRGSELSEGRAADYWAANRGGGEGSYGRHPSP